VRDASVYPEADKPVPQPIALHFGMFAEPH
jgi:hypothetical protein